jgi:hypothetical protein
MAFEQGIGAARDFDGSSAVELTRQFATIRTAGVRDLVRRLSELASAASRDQTLRRIVEQASRPIFEDYQQQAQRREATGNLAASVTSKTVSYDEGVVSVVGPRQTGPVGNRPGRRSGNHAWLVEFGTGPRRPGSRGRKTYVNVHTVINRRMSRAGSFDDQAFANMGRGYYFLMGSLDERARQGAGGRPGYSRDFSDSYGRREQHPITLKPGKSIRPMRRLRLMEDTITARGNEVLGIMRNLLQQSIRARGG